jgi:SAM-dependent methyltransferase
VDDPVDRDAARIAARALSRDDPTGWFEQLYVAAATGDAVVPWDRAQPSALVAEWINSRGDGEGRSAIVVGCGFGRDAELLGTRGWRTVAFDIAPTAVEAARQRHPDSPVSYVVADLLDPPEDWHGGFDLVVESMNVQALPLELRGQAVAGVRSLVGPDGLLLVVAAARLGPDQASVDVGPPWPLDRAEIESFGDDAAIAVELIELVPDVIDPDVQRWCAVFRRTAPLG